MLSAADNELLVRTNQNTPLGEYFRCFWLPVALSEEIPLPDCTPIRVTVMGEELLLFRNSAGKVGLIDRYCAHRGADLFFGRNEECGIRCIYHGWKYDIEGKCIEMPNVPPGAAYHDTIQIKAYPTQEFADMVWAYMGPAESMPALVPQLEVGLVPPENRYVTKRLIECNWAHSMEGALDTAHFSFLHMPAPSQINDDNPDVAADVKRLRWLRNDPTPRFTFVDHEVGFVIGGARHADTDEHYWRLTQYLLPNHSITPSSMPNEIYYGYSWTPITDEACWMYVYAWHPDRAITTEERARFDQGGYGQFAALGPGYLPLRNRSNNYLLSREEQRTESFTGIRGIAEQDQMAQESQGYILDRTKEHLTPTDVGIVHFRKLLLSEVKSLSAGNNPKAAHLGKAYRTRGGGALTADKLKLEEVMIERFGTKTGVVNE